MEDLPINYEYNRATYSNAVWSYKANNKDDANLYHFSDPIYASMTIYAVYDSNAEAMEGSLKML